MKWITLLLLFVCTQTNAQPKIYRYRTEHICSKPIASDKNWEMLNSVDRFLVVLDEINKKLTIYFKDNVVIYITSSEISENQIIYKGIDQDNTKVEARFIVKEGNVSMFLTYQNMIFHHHLIPED